MRLVRRSLAVCLAVLFMAPAASAQTHVIGKSALDKAVQERVAEQQADREAIQSLLQRAEVREIAGEGRPLARQSARPPLSTLHGDDLRQLADQARQVENDLAGGASTIVISTTTIIIVLLLMILIVVIAD